MKDVKEAIILCCFPCIKRTSHDIDDNINQSKNEDGYNSMEMKIDMIAPRKHVEDTINKKVYDELQNEKKISEKRMEDMEKQHREQLEQFEIDKQQHKKLLAEKDRELKRLNQNLLKEEEAIGYTDETWFSISNKLSSIAGSINNMPSNLKSHFNPKKLPKEDIVVFFKECWTESLGYDAKRKEDTIRKVDALFEGKAIGTIYPVVSVLVEKLVFDFLVARIYLAPTHVGFDDTNQAYHHLHDLFQGSQPELMKKLRVQMSHSVSNRIETDKEWKQKRADSKTNLTAEITDCLSKIYKKGELEKQVKKLVVSATKLSFPIHRQRSHILVHHLEIDGELFTNEVNQHNLSATINSNRVFLDIYPVIYADEPAKVEKVKTIKNEDDDDDGNDEEEDDDSEEEEDSEEEDDDEDEDEDEDDGENFTSKKETKKGKQKKQKRKENIGNYRKNYFISFGKAIGYESR